MMFSKLTLAAIIMSLGLVASGFFLLVFNVKLLQNGITKEKVLSQGNDAYESWEHIPAPLFFHVYVFNLTNADEVANGSEHIELQEVGPYVFQDHREKIIHEDDGESITYLPRSLFEFIAERSGNLSLDDSITTVNVPLVIAAKMTHELADKPKFVLDILKNIIKARGKNLMETRTIDEIVFGGYDSQIFDALRTMKKSMEQLGIHKEIPDRMAILYDKNMTEKEGNWTIGTGKSDSMGFASLQLWNGENQMGKWAANSSCDTPRGTDAIQFHADVNQESKLQVFVPSFCRSFSFSYEKSEKVHGVSVNKYFMNSIYDPKLETDRCYCSGNQSVDCSLDGVVDVGPCQQNAPILISKPHFLGAPFYQTNITGLRPDPREHDGWLKVEPWLGVTALAAVRLQINIQLTPEKNVGRDIPFAHNVLPLLWFEATNDFGDEQVQLLNRIFFRKMVILRSISAVFLILGLLIAGATFLYQRRLRSKREYGM